MKIPKEAVQKNFMVNKDYYTSTELSHMSTGEQFKQWDDEIFVFTRFCSKVKIKLDHKGFYCAVVVLKETGEEIHVML